MILLVDDDPLQGFVRKTALEKSFPDVQRVSGAEALCLIEQPWIVERLLLVISGTHMPGLSASEFVAELSSRVPWLPLLVLDGAPAADSPDSGGLVLHLPSSTSGEELLRITREMIDQHKASAA